MESSGNYASFNRGSVAPMSMPDGLQVPFAEWVIELREDTL